MSARPPRGWPSWTRRAGWRKRDGARDMSLRGVAAEAGFAPAALYGYFSSKDDLLLALAADDLTSLARAMRGTGGLAGAGAAALDLLRGAETMAAASAALPGAPQENNKDGDAERLFKWPPDRGTEGAVRCQRHAVRQPRKPVRRGAGGGCRLRAWRLLARSGRLDALGFSPEEMIAAAGRALQAGLITTVPIWSARILMPMAISDQAARRLPHTGRISRPVSAPSSRQSSPW